MKEGYNPTPEEMKDFVGQMHGKVSGKGWVSVNVETGKVERGQAYDNDEEQGEDSEN